MRLELGPQLKIMAADKGMGSWGHPSNPDKSNIPLHEENVDKILAMEKARQEAGSQVRPKVKTIPERNVQAEKPAQSGIMQPGKEVTLPAARPARMGNKPSM